MGFDPISAVAEAGKSFINKIWRDKASEKEIKELEQSWDLEVLRAAHDENSDFRQFIVEYEGAAKDSPRLIQYFRSLIRPSFTCLVGYLNYLYFTGATDAWPEGKVALLKATTVIVLFFWFGERAVTNSGIVEKLIGKK